MILLMPTRERHPKISVITPSYNQGDYIEDTILSVIGQAYPNLEYIVIDGGSTDNTIDTIKKYENYITHWISEKDNGQSSAINKGFSMATGEILCWINSDDMYLPGTFSYVSERLDISKSEILAGNCILIREGTGIATGSDIPSAHRRRSILWCDYIHQPSAFWTRKAWMDTGPLNEDLHYALDWDWFIRAKIGNVSFKVVERPLSIYRFHDAHKTSSGGETRRKELSTIYKKYHDDRGEVLFNFLCRRRIRAGVARKLVKLSYIHARHSHGVSVARQNRKKEFIESLLSRIASLWILIMFPVLSFRYNAQEIRDTLAMSAK
jgi:glycosyltransferase involved in cell wall biosynthesis